MCLFKKKKKVNEPAVTTPTAPKAEHDELTGVLSLDKFYEDAAACLRYYPDGCFAFCRTSVGNIGAINETYGRASGDKVLKNAAAALVSGDDHNIVARDRSKFVVMLRYEDAAHLDRLVSELHDRLSDIGSVLPNKPKVYMHTGIFATDGKLIDMTVEEMVACAKIAESDASKRTHDSVVRYTEQLRLNATEDEEMESEMNDALKKKQFAVCLQPRFDTQTDDVIGAKIMSRWLHPKKGVIGAYRYIPLFVKNGFIIDLDLYLFEQACIVLKGWLDKKLPAVSLSLNVPRLLLTDRRYMETYVNLKKKYKIPDRLCELEFSERLVDDKINSIKEVFEYFKNEGFLISIENFGAGNGHLSTITDLPIDSVKIARDFFDNGIPDEQAQETIRNIFATARAAGVQSIATGVPSSCIELVKELGCEVLQGDVATDPLSAGDFEKKYLRKHY